MCDSGKNMFLNGDEAVAWGARLCRPDVVPVYPITPQTIVVEKISEFLADGEMQCEYCSVESEHSAMATALGASMAGARVFTATSSQGLLYMAEMLHYVSGSRFPVVMMNACRTLAAPWNIFGDQRDAISQRDSGWIQIFVENGQEALDMVIQAYRIAEAVYTPVMLNLDGFVNTHTYEIVNVPEQKQVDAFLPPFKSKNAVDFEHPKSFCMTAGTEWNTEFRIQQNQAMQLSQKVIEETEKEFTEVFGRSYGGMLEEYHTDDARVVLCALGSVCGTIKDVVDELREEGVKVGLVKIRFLRPFPVEFFKKLAPKIQAVGVIDRDISFGYEGALATDVRAAMSRSGYPIKVLNFIAGLAGRDIRKDTIRTMYKRLMQAAAGSTYEDMEFMNTRWSV